MGGEEAENLIRLIVRPSLQAALGPVDGLCPAWSVCWGSALPLRRRVSVMKEELSCLLRELAAFPKGSRLEQVESGAARLLDKLRVTDFSRLCKLILCGSISLSLYGSLRKVGHRSGIQFLTKQISTHTHRTPLILVQATSDK